MYIIYMLIVLEVCTFRHEGGKENLFLDIKFFVFETKDYTLTSIILLKEYLKPLVLTYQRNNACGRRMTP